MSVLSYSDESSVDTSSSGPGVATSKNTAALGAASSIFKCGENPDLSPIQLKYDRRLSSFQGAGQYRKRVASSEDKPVASALDQQGGQQQLLKSNINREEQDE